MAFPAHRFLLLFGAVANVIVTVDAGFRAPEYRRCTSVVRQQLPFLWRRPRYLPRSRPRVTAEAESSFYVNDESGGGSHLVNAGQALVLAADAIGFSQSHAIPRLLRDAGQSVTEIGQSWSLSWEAVTYAADDASSCFFALARLQEDQELNKLYSASASELLAMSGIVGCTSVGPPTALPNLIALSDSLRKIATVVKRVEDYKDITILSQSLVEASDHIQTLANEYII